MLHSSMLLLLLFVSPRLVHLAMSLLLLLLLVVLLELCVTVRVVPA